MIKIGVFANTEKVYCGIFTNSREEDAFLVDLAKAGNVISVIMMTTSNRTAITSSVVLHLIEKLMVYRYYFNSVVNLVLVCSKRLRLPYFYKIINKKREIQQVPTSIKI